MGKPRLSEAKQLPKMAEKREWCSVFSFQICALCPCLYCQMLFSDDFYQGVNESHHNVYLFKNNSFQWVREDLGAKRYRMYISSCLIVQHSPSPAVQQWPKAAKNTNTSQKRIQVSIFQEKLETSTTIVSSDTKSYRTSCSRPNLFTDLEETSVILCEMRKASVFYRRGNWVLERVRHLPKITQVSARTGMSKHRILISQIMKRHRGPS